jgi:ketosteroid isomerase-like protein
MTEADEQLLRGAWEAFGRGDLEAVLAVLDEDVQWHAAGAGDAETACHSRSDVLAFIKRSIAEGVSADLLDIHPVGDGRYVLTLQRHRPEDRGPAPRPHGELVTVRDGKVTEMLVYETVQDAEAAAATA